ncbi:hypothetical protein C3941_22810 [Kaistia algarum]|uniref:hypothetical protein n=1 Tax=Kaistia algarum TaxID=2083279 RepID=UPI000CE7CE7E|nr:hypothetical protein [Kaistia algarum]MCX5514550.1 hypothetical protein [Kaistia algarum]PPE77582.1 hypothetical protein C3941_22810 [Kaistia algarum]
MDQKSALLEIPGGQALLDWFGYPTHFHDAYVLEINLSNHKSSSIRIHSWVMTDQIDANGYYVLDKHVVVIISLEGITHISLDWFDASGIVSDWTFDKAEDLFLVSWTESYGVNGTIKAKRLKIDLVPGKP